MPIRKVAGVAAVRIPALELYGPGSDPLAQVESRGVQQSTGTTNDQVPAEFRDGIDAFFNALENRQ